MVLTFWGKYLCLSRNSYTYNNLIELQKKREFVHLDSVGSIYLKQITLIDVVYLETISIRKRPITLYLRKKYITINNMIFVNL